MRKLIALPPGRELPCFLIELITFHWTSAASGELTWNTTDSVEKQVTSIR
jgi:hypothetical protein